MRWTCGLVMAVLLVSGCGGGKPKDLRSLTSGALNARFVPDPDPPRVGHDSGFSVDLQENGAPVAGARVHLALFYKSMNQTGPDANLVESSPGHYTALDLSTGMNGQWEAKVTVSRSNHPDASFTFPFRVAK